MKTPRILTAGMGTLLFTALSLHAQTWTWTGAAGNNSWNNGGNWSGGVAPPNNGTATIIFGASPRLTPDLTLPWNVNGVIFDQSAGGYDLSSTAKNTLTIGAGGINHYSPERLSIGHPIALSAAQTWRATSWVLEILGAVNNGGNLLTIDGAGSVEIGGAISGSGGLKCDGPGDLLLGGVQFSAANTYSGTTIINSGFLILDKFNGITAVPGTLLVGDGVGTAIDRVQNNASDQIADGATVSISPTGAWRLFDRLLIPAEPFSCETISFLNISSTEIAGGGLVTVGSGALTVLGNVVMTGGALETDGTGKLCLNGSLITIASSVTASISSQLDLGGGGRIFTIADGAAPNDLNVTGVVSNGAIHKDGSGALRLGAANNYADGTTLNAGTILIGHDSALGNGPLVANSGKLRADGAARTIKNQLTGSGAVFDGGFDLTLAGGVNLNGGITKNGSGVLNFAKAGAISGALEVKSGTVGFDAEFAAGNGLTNSAAVLIREQALTVNGTGINNQGLLTIAGGTLAGSGPTTNNGSILGHGTIGGSGSFTNNTQLTVSGGNFTLAKGGENLNAGSIAVPSGLQIRLTGGTLANTGSITLTDAIVAGTATLSNNAGGTVSGRGLISAPFANSGGTLRPVGGTMNVEGAFANSSVIRLEGGAGLIGGAINNTGRIQGDGSIANAIANTGRIEPIGTLQLGGAVTNTGAGLISATPGNSVVFTSGLATNAATISLVGGTFDNNGFTFNNTGQLSGSGRFWSGGVTNNGSGRIEVSAGGDFQFLGTLANASIIDVIGGALRVEGATTNAASTGLIVGRNAVMWLSGGLINGGALAFSNGVNEIFGDITNSVSGRIIVSGGAAAIFYDDIANSGSINVSASGSLSSIAVFFGSLSGGGVAGTGQVFIEGDARPGASPGVMSFGGDVSFGPSARTIVEIGGTAPGSQYDRVTIAGATSLGGLLELRLINGFVPSAGQTFDVLDTTRQTGTFSSLQLPTLAAGLFWRTERLYTDGTLTVCTTPNTFEEYAAFYGLNNLTGDADGDGESNVLEFLLGQNPHIATLAGQAGEYDGTTFIYEFDMPDLPPAGAVYYIETSPNLVAWGAQVTRTGSGPWTGPAAGEITVTPFGNCSENVSIALKPLGASKFFVRLRGELTP